jgi:hypothetical protein
MPSASNAACPVLKRTSSTTGCYGLRWCEIASDEEIYGVFDSNPCRRPSRGEHRRMKVVRYRTGDRHTSYALRTRSDFGSRKAQNFPEGGLTPRRAGCHLAARPHHKNSRRSTSDSYAPTQRLPSSMPEGRKSAGSFPSRSRWKSTVRVPRRPDKPSFQSGQEESGPDS